MSAGLARRVEPGSQADRLLKLVSSPFQASFQLDAFWASLATSIGVTLLLAIVFSLLRPRHSLVYAPRLKHTDSKHAPPVLDKGFLSWLKPVLRTKENDLVDRIGLDAVFFLRFTRMLRNMLLVLSAVGVLIMIPVNVSMAADFADKSNGFAIMTPLYIFGNGLWAQVVVAYAVDITVAFFLWWNYRAFHRLRRAHFDSPDYQDSLHARSVMLRDIPASAQSDEGILRLTDEVNPTGVLPKTTLGRNVKILPDLIEEHEESVRKLETVLAKYLKNPDRLPVNRPTMKAPKSYNGPTSNGRIDSIEYLTERIRRLEAHINDVRERIDRRDPMPYGFATWESISQAHTVAYAARKKHPQGTRIRLAPRPNDIIWKNMYLGKGTRGRKRWANAVWITLLTVAWTPLNAGIAIFLSNLSNLGSVWPAFDRSLQRHRTWWTLVQGIAAPGLTSIVYLILPIIFRRLQIRAGDVSKTSRERHVLRNLYNFFTLNNLLIFSLFSAIWQYITFVINDSSGGNVWGALKSGDFFLTVTTALCQISPFWATWCLQRNLGAAIDIAQLWTLFYIWFSKTFMSPTPRQRIEWTAPPAFDYASYYNYFLFYATVALCFSTLQPVVMVVTALYFCIDCVLKKYLLMYVFVTKTESGGQFWRTLFNRLVFATILANVIIGVVVKARGTWGMVIALAPAIICMLAFKWYCARTFDDSMHYYHRIGMQANDSVEGGTHVKGLSRATAKFRHPALEKPLMTPMVHAKARHVLSQIYSGRLGSDAAQYGNYDDIAMQPMNQGAKPQQDAPFEIVPEAQQDFMYYRNRSDFREEAGELYGRPDDLISERSGTPMSFMSGPIRASTPYNDSPEPILGDAKPDHQSSPTPQKIHRKQLSSGVLPVFRQNDGYEAIRGEGMKDQGDLSMGQGRYIDPGEDSQNLLGGVGELRTPNGEFMSINRFQTSGTTSMSATPRTDDIGSYDYFRTGQR